MNNEENALRINHGKTASVSENEMKTIGPELDAILDRIKKQGIGYSEENARRDRQRAIGEAEARIIDAVPSIFRIQVKTAAPRPELETLKEGKAILILGGVGTGKTTIGFTLAYQFLSWRFRNPPKSGRVEYAFYSESEYFARLQDKRNKNEDFAFRESALKKSFLFFDDILSRSAGNYEHGELLYLVDGRYKWLQPTIYTSNKSLNEIGAFDDRIASRLASGLVIKTESEEDFRLNKNH